MEQLQELARQALGRSVAHEPRELSCDSKAAPCLNVGVSTFWWVRLQKKGAIPGFYMKFILSMYQGNPSIFPKGHLCPLTSPFLLGVEKKPLK